MRTIHTLLAAGLAAGLSGGAARAAVITIDLTGSDTMAPSLSYSLGAANTALLESLGFTGGDYNLVVSPTVNPEHLGGAQLVRRSDGIGVCSHFKDGACDESQGNFDEEVDGSGDANKKGAEWEGLSFALTGAPANFDFILVDATFTNVHHEGDKDDAFFLYSGNGPLGDEFHIYTDAASCTGTGEHHTCTVAFNALGRDFQFRALGDHDGWKISAIRWEISELVNPSEVPEPASLALLGVALLGVGAGTARRRRRLA